MQGHKVKAAVQLHCSFLAWFRMDIVGIYTFVVQLLALGLHSELKSGQGQYNCLTEAAWTCFCIAMSACQKESAESPCWNGAAAGGPVMQHATSCCGSAECGQ